MGVWEFHHVARALPAWQFEAASQIREDSGDLLLAARSQHNWLIAIEGVAVV